MASIKIKPLSPLFIFMVAKVRTKNPQKNYENQSKDSRVQLFVWQPATSRAAEENFSMGLESANGDTTAKTETGDDGN